MSATLSTFQSAVNPAKEFDYIFCHNEEVLYKAVEQYAPELFEEIRRLTAQGKWHIMGGWYVDGEEVSEYPWYFPDHNPHKSWLGDEFIVPAKYIRNKKRVKIEIVPQECGGKCYFNEFEYKIFGIV